MWSQPNINSMNREARRLREQLEERVRAYREGRDTEHCEECGRPAADVEFYYDIFSEDPKGLVRYCNKHRGIVTEGYFTCPVCERLFVTNYTWELYYTEEGVCLPCALKRAIESGRYWFDLTPETIEALSYEYVREAPHLIGVDMPVPKTIRRVEGVAFDSWTGTDIGGGGVAGLQRILRHLRSLGYRRAMLILDAGFQFAVNIGVYVDHPKPKVEQTATGQKALRLSA